MLSTTSILSPLLKDHPAGWMLWEGSPLEQTSRRLQELGVGSVVFDPCGNRPATGDYLTVQRANLERLRQIYGPDS
jgi:zinc transport system substrate-binding protein